MENIMKNATNIDVDQITESGQQAFDGASDTVKTIGDYFGVDTIIIWLVALVAIIFVGASSANSAKLLSSSLSLQSSSLQLLVLSSFNHANQTSFLICDILSELVQPVLVRFCP